LVDLGEVLGPAGRRLGDAVRAAATWRGRFGAVDRFLLGRVESAPAITGDVAFAWRELERSGGAVPIQVICRQVGWSHKHLITRFREQIGLTPKRAARVIRFERVLRRLDEAPRPDWARLAAECGYADQAHLIRDFAEFAGTTPAAATGRAWR
jgi:AraC-like DNA-binding protein